MRRSRQRFGVVLVEEFDVWNDIEFRGEFRVGSAFSNVSNHIRGTIHCGFGRALSCELELLRRGRWSKVGKRICLGRSTEKTSSEEEEVIKSMSNNLKKTISIVNR